MFDVKLEIVDFVWAEDSGGSYESRTFSIRSTYRQYTGLYSFPSGSIEIGGHPLDQIMTSLIFGEITNGVMGRLMQAPVVPSEEARTTLQKECDGLAQILTICFETMRISAVVGESFELIRHCFKMGHI